VTPDGSRFTIPRFSRSEGGVYAAIGLSPRWTVTLNLPLVRSSDLDDFPDELMRTTGIGDAQLGVQRQLGARGAWVFAARLTAQFPTGDVSKGFGLLPTGSGVTEGDLVFEAGRGLGNGQGWMFVGAGPQVRGGGLRDGFTFGAQAGWNARPRLSLMASLRGVEPRSHEAPREARGNFTGLGDRVAYVIAGPSFIVKLGARSGVQLDAEFVLRARNLARGPVYRAGVFWSR
jgi:hypothetical protein